MSSIRTRFQQHKILLCITLLWLIGTLLWGISHVDALGGRPLVFLWGTDPGNYDPQQTSHPIAQEVFRHVCEPLFYEDQSGTLRGLLAEDEFVYEAGGRRLLIKLRPQILFHDGTLLDASAVQASFERLQQLGTSPLINELRQVQVAAQPDGQQVRFILPEPDYEFARLVLSSPYAAIVSPITDNLNSPFIECTGPYTFVPELYEPDHWLTLVRYPAYSWPPLDFNNRGAAKIPQIHFQFEARDQRFALLQQGEGCVLSLDKEQIQTAAAQSNLELYDAEGGITYLGFNFLHPRWQDVRVRQAIAQAMDKALLAASGPFVPAHTPLGMETVGYDERVAEYGYGYDPQISKRLLTETRFEKEGKIVLLIPESRTYRELAALVVEQLAAIGLHQVQIQEAPRAEILTQRQDFDLLLFDYAWGDYTALAIFLGAGPRNLLNYANGEVAALVRKARLESDPTLRQEWILAAQRIVLEDAVWQPLVLRRLVLAVNQTCVQGERQSPFGELLFHDAETD